MSNKFDFKDSLSNIGTIFGKEMKSYFSSAVAYVLIVVFLIVLDWFYVQNIFISNQASMRGMFSLIPVTFLILIPALTMRLIAEEKKSGTIELLTTKPLRDYELVLGKFFAAWAVIGIALLPTFLYFITVLSLGDLDIGPVISSYIGLMLMAALFIAVSLLASSLTENQVVAIILGFIFIVTLYILDDLLSYIPEWTVSTVEYLGINYHYQNFVRGVIDTRNIIYFLCAIGFSLYLTVVSLERRKW